MTKVNKTFYGKIGPEGLEKIARDFSVNTDITFVRKEIEMGDKVLDLACGYGRVTLLLAKEGIDIVGIDLDSGLIEEAIIRNKKQGHRVRFDVGNMSDLPYADNSFDKVLCLWNSFNELLTPIEQVKTLSEIERVLKVGGSALLILLNGDSAPLKEAVKMSSEGRVVTSHFQGEVVKQYIHDINSLKKLLKKAHFKRFEIKHINMHKRRRIAVRLHK